MKEIIISLLKPFADLCFRCVNSISTDVAVFLYIFVLVAVAAWVLTLKQEKPKRTQKLRKPLFVHDLRVWAILILFVQAVIYIIFR
ncbi:MAG: hypothetical protein MUO22_08545 [Sedimentisphaerales bacterium]|nr:hypothetical protein [Sedimentisphaerales bacterium]